MKVLLQKFSSTLNVHLHVVCRFWDSNKVYDIVPGRLMMITHTHVVSNFHVNLYMHSVLHMMEDCEVYFPRKFAFFNHICTSFYLYANFYENSASRNKTLFLLSGIILIHQHTQPYKIWLKSPFFSRGIWYMVIFFGGNGGSSIHRWILKRRKGTREMAPLSPSACLSSEIQRRSGEGGEGGGE